MEGLVIVIAILIALGVGARLVLGNRAAGQKEPQSTEPPGERSAPDDWPRDGGDNPTGP